LEELHKCQESGRQVPLEAKHQALTSVRLGLAQAREVDLKSLPSGDAKHPPYRRLFQHPYAQSEHCREAPPDLIEVRNVARTTVTLKSYSLNLASTIVKRKFESLGYRRLICSQVFAGGHSAQGRGKRRAQAACDGAEELYPFGVARLTRPSLHSYRLNRVKRGQQW
jgi:hypothetical protein